jgi:shikimate dehydrogenase
MSKLFAIFGDPVNHSKSPLMHNLAFKLFDIKSCYTRYHLTNGEKLKSKFLDLDLSGANITVPHKETAFKACDWCDDFAKSVGAVNTIVSKNGKLYGYNTDATGFFECIKIFEGIKKILIIGAGGTSKSTSMLLKNKNFDVVILNRSAEKLISFKNNGFMTYTHETLNDFNFDLIINMTSAGLYNDDLPAPKELLKQLLEQTKGCIDIIYGKETPFLKLARELKIKNIDGSMMLLKQGVLAFDYFTEHMFELKDIEEKMKNAFDFC